MRNSRLIRAAATAAAAFICLSASADHRLGIKDVACDTGLRSYQQSLYPLQRQQCTGCHAEGGIGVGHSVADPVAAYEVTRGLVNFGNPAASRVVAKVRSKHWLNYDGPPLPVEPDDVRTLIESWWSGGEDTCPQRAALVTQPQMLPSLPTRESGQYMVVTFDLGASNAAFAGCRFTVEVQKFSEFHDPVPGSYRARNPRVGCLNRPLKVAGIRLPVSGRVEGFENAYETVRMTVPAAANLDTDLTLLSRESSILIQRLLQNDTLSLMFGEIEIATARNQRRRKP